MKPICVTMNFQKIYAKLKTYLPKHTFLLLSLSFFNNVAIVHTIEPYSNSESFNSFQVERERATTPNQTQQKAKIQKPKP